MEKLTEEGTLIIILL